MKRIIYCLFWLILIVPASAQDTRQAPYLYYFANDLNAFIIERADGTDRRIFAENVMPTETISVNGAGWSPSGNWFAWTAVQGTYEDLLQTGYVISRDETTSYELLKTGQPHISAMLWSPTEDFLLVGYQDSPSQFPLNPHFELLDMATQAVLLSFDLPANISFLNIHWFNEGLGIVLTYNSYNGHSFAGSYLRRMTLDGEMQEFEIGFSHGGATDTNWIAYSNPANTSLMLWNLVDNVERHFDLPEGKYHWGQWDFRGEYYAFQLEQNCRNPLACLSDLWVVAPTFHELYLVSNNIYYHDRQVSAWSPDTQTIVYTTTGSSGYYRADTHESELIIIPDECDCAVPYFS